MKINPNKLLGASILLVLGILGYLFNEGLKYGIVLIGMILLIAANLIIPQPVALTVNAPSENPEWLNTKFGVNPADFNAILFDNHLYNGTKTIFSSNPILEYTGMDGVSGLKWRIVDTDKNIEVNIITYPEEMLNEKTNILLPKKVITGDIKIPVSQHDAVAGNCPCAIVYIEK
ncbi:MAG: hypothetical protein WC462_03605 [archaeon]